MAKIKTSVPVERTPDPAAAITGRRFALVFAALLAARMGSSVSANIISTALPTIEGELGGVDMMQWITTSYIMATTIMMPVYGRLGDMVGRKRLIIVALALYLTGNVVCMLASDIGMLVAGRVVSGLGGGGTVILAQAIVGAMAGPEKRATYLAILGATFTAGAFIGPILGGLIIEVASWRWIFAATLPFAIVGIAGCALFLPKPRPNPHAKFDVRGSVLLGCAVVSLVLLSSSVSSQKQMLAVNTVAYLVLTAVFGWLFVRRERTVAAPIMPPRMFRNRDFVLATAASMICWLTFMGLTYYFPTWLQIAKGLSPTLAGLCMAAALGGNMVSSMATGYLASATGRYKAFCVAMFPVAAVGYGLLSTVTVATPTAVVLCYLFLAGFGLGIGSSLLLNVVQGEFPVSRVGTATGAHNFFKQIGKTLGSAIVGTLFSTGLAAHLADVFPKSMHLTFKTVTPALVDKLPEALRHVVQSGYTSALMPIFMGYVPLLIVGFVLCCLLRKDGAAAE